MGDWPSIPAAIGAFRVRLSANQAQATGYNKVPFNVKDFDVSDWFDAVTNFRYQPKIAGYYSFTAALETVGTNGGSMFVSIAKNGTQFNAVSSGALFNGLQLNASFKHFLNGTTDYVECFSYFSAASGNTLYGGASGDWSWFTGELIGT